MIIEKRFLGIADHGGLCGIDGGVYHLKQDEYNKMQQLLDNQDKLVAYGKHKAGLGVYALGQYSTKTSGTLSASKTPVLLTINASSKPCLLNSEGRYAVLVKFSDNATYYSGIGACLDSSISSTPNLYFRNGTSYVPQNWTDAYPSCYTTSTIRYTNTVSTSGKLPGTCRFVYSAYYTGTKSLFGTWWDRFNTSGAGYVDRSGYVTVTTNCNIKESTLFVNSTSGRDTTKYRASCLIVDVNNNLYWGDNAEFNCTISSNNPLGLVANTPAYPPSGVTIRNAWCKFSSYASLMFVIQGSDNAFYFYTPIATTPVWTKMFTLNVDVAKIYLRSAYSGYILTTDGNLYCYGSDTSDQHYFGFSSSDGVATQVLSDYWIDDFAIYSNTSLFFIGSKR